MEVSTRKSRRQYQPQDYGTELRNLHFNRKSPPEHSNLCKRHARGLQASRRSEVPAHVACMEVSTEQLGDDGYS